jgi:hypothetical protein
MTRIRWWCDGMMKVVMMGESKTDGQNLRSLQIFHEQGMKFWMMMGAGVSFFFLFFFSSILSERHGTYLILIMKDDFGFCSSSH